MVYVLNNDTKIGTKKVVSLKMIKGDGDDRLIEVEDATPDGGLHFGHGRALVSGRRVITERIPKRLTATSNGPIPDFGYQYHLNYVSDKFKSVVGAVEPGVHQFIPFQIVGAKKAVLADMWFMVVCNRLDSVDREHTTLVLDEVGMWLPGREVPRDQWPPNFDPNVKGKFVFSLAQIGNHHLWYDKHSIYGPYLSDELANALTAAGITGIDLRKQDAV